MKIVLEGISTDNPMMPLKECIHTEELHSMTLKFRDQEEKRPEQLFHYF